MAAFDLDGTLVHAHTLPRFVVALAGPAAVAHLGLGGLRGLRIPPSREVLKEAAIGGVLRGRCIDDVRVAGERFADRLVERHLGAEPIARLRAHQASGDLVVIISAALDVYVQAVASRLGIDHSISTEVVVDDRRRCTGQLRNAALHGDTKAELLQHWVAARVPGARVHAYGNSRDDDALLRYAERTRTSPTRETA